MISPESITQAAAEAATPSQFLACLAGIMAAHGEDAGKLLELTAEAVIGETDRIILNKFFGGGSHAA